MSAQIDSINRTIRAQLAYEGKTATGLAKYMGLYSQSVFNRLSGDTEWKLADLCKVADYLGISLWDLMSRAETNAEINSKSTVKGGTK